jgi:DGQHR domain-containing protein
MSEIKLSFSLPAIRIHQREESDQAIYVARVKARDFLQRPKERFKVDYYVREDKEDRGYQRKAAPKDIAKIKDYVLKQTDSPLFPTGMLLNCRNKIDFDEKTDGIGTLHINEILYVIDGQHRFEAWSEMMTSPELEKQWGDFEFPVVILSNFDEVKEVEQFFVVNTRQKKVKTDLAQRNLLTLAKDKDTRGLVPVSKKWELTATKMVDILNEEMAGSIWENKIILPSDDVEIKRIKSISQNSFITSLKSFFVGRYPLFISEGRPLTEEWAEFIDGYWKVVEKVYPEAVRDINDYSMMKSVGVFTLHKVLNLIIKKFEGSGSMTSGRNREKIYKEAEQILGRAARNKFPLEFWRTSVPKQVRLKGEYIGSYSSTSGQDALAQKIYFA